MSTVIKAKPFRPSDKVFSRKDGEAATIVEHAGRGLWTVKLDNPTPLGNLETWPYRDIQLQTDPQRKREDDGQAVDAMQR